MKGQCRLNYSRCSCRGLGVTNLRLHRTKADVLSFLVVCTKKFGETLKLGSITSNGSGTVGLDKAHGGGIKTCV